MNGATLLYFNDGTFEEMCITLKLNQSKLNSWLMKLVKFVLTHIFYVILWLQFLIWNNFVNFLLEHLF